MTSRMATNTKQTRQTPDQPVTRCAQCDSAAPLTPSEYGPLCQLCAFRQSQHDNARDNYSQLSAATFGFTYEDE